MKRHKSKFIHHTFNFTHFSLHFKCACNSIILKVICQCFFEARDSCKWLVLEDRIFPVYRLLITDYCLIQASRPVTLNIDGNIFPTEFL